ncbi:MAG: hypothetical protein Ct9H300mP28_27820 [Pseudomonadota bacterium]|nr:MAG: hypothetical protein Ct9H300mP28_27820 [Pseudomonadota bacterium]
MGIWNLTYQKTFRGHERSVETLDFSDDNKFPISSSSDKTVRIWKVDSKNNSRVIDIGSHRVQDALLHLTVKVLPLPVQTVQLLFGILKMETVLTACDITKESKYTQLSSGAVCAAFCRIRQTVGTLGFEIR